AQKQESQKQSDDSLIGQLLDSRFRIISRLGKGGMSEVFRAEHLILQKDVAIKLLHSSQSEKLNSMERFQQEAKAVSSLDHPNIIKVYAFGMNGEHELYMAMDFLPGRSLAELLQSEGHLHWRRALDLSIQIAEGLKHAHEKGVIHRDLKPSNIMLESTDAGREIPKIVDFGIARLTDESAKEDKHLTRTGNTCGSPPYMSPEQCMGDEVSACSDVYSFACMLYELLSGKRPFYAKSSVELMQKHLNETPLRFASLCPEIEIPPSLEAIVRKCLSKDPADRYQNMAELLLDLKTVGTSSEHERELEGALEAEFGVEKKARQGRIAHSLLPMVASLVLLLAVAAFLYNLFLPQIQIYFLRRELDDLKPLTAQSSARKMKLLPAIAELYRKIGDRETALSFFRRDLRELAAQPFSIAAAQEEARIVRALSRMKKHAEADELRFNLVVKLEKYIKDNTLAKTNTAGLISAELLIIDLCRNDPSKQDIVWGKYHMLIAEYTWLQNYKQLELVCRSAIKFAAGKVPDHNLLIVWKTLADAQIQQKKISDAESSLKEALKLSSQVSGLGDAYRNSIQEALRKLPESRPR
ncbi:MAG: serine/threonine protein kinase, partial [Candidatus Obscuribacterales bacterium]|nr:serine/threonine protein kinase [Candidatus Obscuribacterales bacterium]